MSRQRKVVVDGEIIRSAWLGYERSHEYVNSPSIHSRLAQIPIPVLDHHACKQSKHGCHGYGRIDVMSVVFLLMLEVLYCGRSIS